MVDNPWLNIVTQVSTYVTAATAKAALNTLPQGFLLKMLKDIIFNLNFNSNTNPFSITRIHLYHYTLMFASSLSLSVSAAHDWEINAERTHFNNLSSYTCFDASHNLHLTAIQSRCNEYRSYSV